VLITAPWFGRPALAQTDSIPFSKSLADSVVSSRLSTQSIDSTVWGSVAETVNGRQVPLVGATVLWAGTSAGTVTDSVGRFQLARLPGTSRLVFSYVGYASDTVVIADPAVEVNVLLRADSPRLIANVAGGDCIGCPRSD
jgi:hypothetical protein